ncbi:MAG: LamG-like jellyroll fold domain-containing protein, partial [Candidatus Kariarchaeaceae archaeon]
VPSASLISVDGTLSSASDWAIIGVEIVGDLNGFGNPQEITEENVGRGSDNWDYYKSIFIDSSQVPADLTNFTLLISIFDSDLKTKAQNDGDDIAFFNAGTQLPHDFEVYDPSFNGTHAQMIAWVKTDLSSTTDTQIIMKYGNSTMSSQENSFEVWSGIYDGVWHLEEDPTGTIIDSVNNNNGTVDPSKNMDSSDLVSGKINNAINFDGINDSINVGDLNADTWPALTMSVWVYKTDTGDDRVFSISTSTSSSDSIFALLMTGDPTPNFRTRIGTDGVGGTQSSTITGPTYTTNTWYHFAVTWDSVTETITIYVDGQSVATAAKDGDSILDTTQVALIGNALPDQDRFFNGTIDEVRVGSTAKSAAWIETEYNNQNDPTAFHSISDEFTYDETEALFDTLSDVDSDPNFGTSSNFINMFEKDGLVNTFSEQILPASSHSLQTLRSGRMRVGDGFSVHWGTESGTISFWMKFFNLTTTVRPWGLGDDMEIRSGGSQMALDFGQNDSSSSMTTSSVFSLYKWYFIAVTWNQNNDTLKVYVGDESTAPTVDSNSLIGTWTGTVVGKPITEHNFMASRSTQPVDGRGDDLRYYDVDRSISDLQSDYQNTLYGDEPNLRSYFKLDNDFTDSGPDGNDGSSTGGTMTFQTDTPSSFSSSFARMDQEIQWNGIPYQDVTGELKIYTGTSDAEDILL